MEETYHFVCKDDDGDWYYFPEDRMYKRMKGNFVRGWIIRGRIYGNSLPDPFLLLVRRKKLYPHASQQDISPTEATFKLWEHWQGQLNKMEMALCPA